VLFNKEANTTVLHSTPPLHEPWWVMAKRF